MSRSHESSEAAASRPPRLAIALLERLVTGPEREWVLGDLLEEYELIAGRSAEAEARRWLWWQALHSALPLVQRRLVKAFERTVLARRNLELQPATEGTNMFERALLADDETPRMRQRWWTFPAAIGLHVAFLVGAVFSQVWHVDEALEPAVITLPFQMVRMPPPPPPPAGPGRVKPQIPGAVQRPRSEVRLPSLPVQPLTVPSSVPEPLEPVLDVALPELDFAGAGAGGEPGGVDGGQIGGVEGGEIDGVVGSPFLGAPGTPEQPLQVAGAVRKPEALREVAPRYTECARRARIEGAAIVEAIIDRQGRVTHARILKDLGCGLGEEARRAVEQWQFRPATLNGRPVAVYFSLSVTFRLR